MKPRKIENNPYNSSVLLKWINAYVKNESSLEGLISTLTENLKDVKLTDKEDLHLEVMIMNLRRHQWAKNKAESADLSTPLQKTAS